MSKTVINNTGFLRALHSLKPAQRTVLLKNADSNNIRSICECAHNILCGKVTLNKKQRDSLRRHKKHLRKLVKRGDNWQKKKKILVQSGGAFLPLLIGPLISGVLSSLFKGD